MAFRAWVVSAAVTFILLLVGVFAGAWIPARFTMTVWFIVAVTVRLKLKLSQLIDVVRQMRVKEIR